MAKFMYVFRGGAFVTPSLSPTEVQAHLAKWTEWVGALAKAGHHHQGGHPIKTAGKLVRGHDKVVTDGPYAESKDIVTGTLVIEATSLDAATELARGCPVFELDGSVEVRPLLEREA
jgi:hypothetical protein